MNLKNEIQKNRKGLLSMFGAFLLQLCAGSYHGTFGNLLPYITSYLRQVISENKIEHGEYFDKIILLIEDSDDVSNGDVAMIMSVGGLAQGISFLMG